MVWRLALGENNLVMQYRIAAGNLSGDSISIEEDGDLLKVWKILETKIMFVAELLPHASPVLSHAERKEGKCRRNIVIIAV